MGLQPGEKAVRVVPSHERAVEVFDDQFRKGPAIIFAHARPDLADLRLPRHQIVRLAPVGGPSLHPAGLD